MSNKFSMDDYIDVAERIIKFNEKYPEGSLQTIDWKVTEVADKTFIVYRAAAYRTADDRRPGHGTAWEPFPGPTPYTKDSELMNAETAAWGRAIVACGLPASRKIASKQEMQARQGTTQVTAPVTELVSKTDIAELQSAASGLKGPQIKLAFGAAGIPVPEPFVWNRVPKDQAAALAKALAGMERPTEQAA